MIHVFAEPGPTDVTAAWVAKLNGKSAYPTWQGVNGGQNSGDVRCFMRYDNATNYISLADSGVRYAAIERQGLALTDNPLGTETNASRVPQPRYFDSASGRGRYQILCVNDALNPSGPVGTCKF